MWTLIQFIDDDDDNDYDVIPTSWIVNNTTCVFPQEKASKVKFLVKSNASPDKTWEEMQIQIIHNEIGNYNKALQMMFRAAKKAPLFSDDEKGRGHRQKKETKFHGECDSEENSPRNRNNSKELLEESHYPTVPPSFSVKYNKQASTPAPHKRTTLPPSELASNPSSSSAQNNDPVVHSHSTFSLSAFENVNVNCDIKTKHNCTFDGNNLLFSIAQQLCKLSVDMTKMKTHLKHIRENTNEKVNATVEESYDADELFLFPIKNEEQLHNIETQLKNPDNNNKLIKTLLHQAEGKSVPKMVGSIMAYVISNEVASNFSWKGQKSKQAFQEMELAKAVLQS
ncbi:hypothetical protein PPYR_07458 [Photinus pyralis]|uniref:DUF4806 domain-containing protein n=2 Tax=Photinus pyralis TaxID=7054 RepID=A0A1Y1MCZ6_PHOPY|nr:hypothetical protein PPYR_07457 [Photinus pyralis]KAB0799578.1 hypothetical protein PPYR_07458 [Photinus pyralis]